jgi:hypothetical protein
VTIPHALISAGMVLAVLLLAVGIIGTLWAAWEAR